MGKTALFLILTIPLFGHTQTGPGGIGASDGSSTLVLWLDANTITTTDGATVTSWTDDSGYGHDFTIGTGAVWNDSTVNNYPAFNFNGTSHYFERTFTAAIFPSSFSVFSTTKVMPSGLYKSPVSFRGNSAGLDTEGFFFYSIPTSNNWEFWTGANLATYQILTGGSTAGSWSQQTMSYAVASTDKRLYIDGGLSASTTSHVVRDNAVDPARIGAGFNEGFPNFYFNGDIGEVIMYNTVVNSAQRIIIDNYLAAKYNYALLANDIFNEDDGANGDYDHEVAGIGRVDASNLHNDAQGTGIVRILNPSGLGDNEFLLWGHDDRIQIASNTTDVPGIVQARFDRVWRVSEINSSGSAIDVGSIEMRWDLSGVFPSTASDLRLLIDTDNDGLFADEVAISGATSLGADIYAFTGVTAIANNLRFTLGTIDTLQTPLPIALVDFTAQSTEDVVNLNWSTASEINNDFFTVERSIDGKTFEVINQINGAGNSNTTLLYTSIQRRSID